MGAGHDRGTGGRRHAVAVTHRRWPWAVAAGAVLLVAAAAGVVGVSWPRSSPPPPAPVSVSSDRPAPPLAGYAGAWRSHGLTITFDASGGGRMAFRTYTPCSEPEPGVPCEPHGPADVGRATVVLEPAGPGGLQLRTVTTNDVPDRPAGHTEPVRVVRDGVLAVGSGDDGWGLCRGETYDPICGA